MITTEEIPQIIPGNHILIGAKSAAEPVIFLLQIRCAKLTTDGLNIVPVHPWLQQALLPTIRFLFSNRQWFS